MKPPCRSTSLGRTSRYEVASTFSSRAARTATISQSIAKLSQSPLAGKLRY